MSFNMICQYQFIKSVILCVGDSMKPLKTRVSITIDDPILERLKDLAEYQDRSLSSYINLVLREHLEQLDKRQNKKAPG